MVDMASSYNTAYVVAVAMYFISRTPRVSDQPHGLPVTMSFMTTKDCDYILLSLIKDLRRTEIIRSVKVGPTAF